MENKLVVITGASSGIGKSCAFEFAKNNYNVILVARSEDILKQICTKIKNDRIKVAYKAVDITSEDSCKKIMSEIINEYRKIDILINNAGISEKVLFETVDLKITKKIMKTNFWGTVYCTKYALSNLIKTKGSIIFVSSIAGIKGIPGRTGYSASKYAVQGFLEALRIENLKKSLHILIAYPDYTSTNIRFNAIDSSGKSQGKTPRNESIMMTPDYVAKKIFYAYQKKKNSIIISKNFSFKLIKFLNLFFPRIIDNIILKTVGSEPDSPF